MKRTAYIKKGALERLFRYEFEGFELKPGETCILKSGREIDHGKVVAVLPGPPEDNAGEIAGRILRPAGPDDLKQIETNRNDSREAFAVCRRLIEEKGLAMKLVSGEYSFDRSRLLFTFTSEGRIDFRELVRDLARIFKTRIELRQIGVRDEAKIKGGVGPCGYALCCATFLSNFEPINIRVAKQQRLSLDPDKISGMCGRLLCCLKYEEQFYRCAVRSFPRDGAIVKTPEGEGKVVDLNYIRRTVTVEFDDERMLEFPLEDLKGRKNG